MVILGLRPALAFVACGALLLVGCPDRSSTEQAKENKGTVEKEDKKPDQPAPDDAEKAAKKDKKPDQSAPSETEQAAKKDKKPDQPAPGDVPPPIPLSKWNLAYAEKTWGLKLKSMSYKEPARPYHTRLYTFLVEFTKDLTPEELKAVQEVFPQQGRGGAPKVEVYFFDKEDVALEKQQTAFQALSELTGVKGDAFRMGTSGPGSLYVKDAVRAELRPIKP